VQVNGKKREVCGLLVPKHSYATMTRYKTLHKPWMPTLRAAAEREKLQIPRPRSVTGGRRVPCFEITCFGIGATWPLEW
jgi:hypothetical protein